MLDRDEVIKMYNECKVGEPDPHDSGRIIESVTVKDIIRHKEKSTGDRGFY